MRTQLVALLITITSAVPVVAQVLRGTVQDAASGQPLTGVFITLHDADGRMQLGTLTDSLGRFFLHPSQTGAYRIRAELIGYESVRSEVRTQAGVATEVNLVMPVNAIRLREIAVTQKRSCTSDAQEARATAAVWEEARKALSVAAWLDRDAGARFRIRILEETLDLRRRRREYPDWQFHSIVGRKTFEASPADSLLDVGFVQVSTEGPVTYYGPDAELLVSPRFSAEHCFSIERRSDRKGMIGLAFEPMSSRRVPGIRGALWLDETTGVLKFIDYEYVRMPMRVDRDYAGGQVNVRQLPNGAFIVDSYRITMPLLQQVAGRPIYTAGLRERSGEVLDISLNGQTIELVPRYAVRGTVYDSLLARPLANATVVVRGAPFTAATDTTGAFTLEGVPPGFYLVDFEGPTVDGRPNPRTYTLRVDSADTRVSFGMPSRSTLLALLCPRDRALRSAARRMVTDAARLGVLQLQLHSADGAPWRGSPPVVELAFARPAAGQSEPDIVHTRHDADERGVVTACGVPIGEQVEVVVRSTAATRVLTLTIPPDGFLRTTLVPN